MCFLSQQKIARGSNNSILLVLTDTETKVCKQPERAWRTEIATIVLSLYLQSLCFLNSVYSTADRIPNKVWELENDLMRVMSL